MHKIPLVLGCWGFCRGFWSKFTESFLKLVPFQISNLFSLIGMPWWIKVIGFYPLLLVSSSLLFMKRNVPTPFLLRCFVMLLLRNKSALLVNISFSCVKFITLDPLLLQFKYLLFLQKGSAKIQLHPLSPSLCLPCSHFASWVHFMEFMLTVAFYTSLYLVQTLSQDQEACTSIINHYSLINYKLHGILSVTYS